MQGVILAAGYGTRLKPLTDSLPKALVLLDGKPLLYHVIEKFIRFGIKDIVINAHYFADKVEDYLQKSNFDARITVVRENKILGTGGGIKNMEKYITGDLFLVHNVDVVSNVDLDELLFYHKQNDAFVTMVMEKRVTGNKVIVDKFARICGVDYIRKRERFISRDPGTEFEYLAFDGIHLVSSKIFSYFQDDGFFSIIKTYLDLIKIDKKILSFKLKENGYWLDVGTPEKLQQAEKEVKCWKL